MLEKDPSASWKWRRGPKSLSKFNNNTSNEPANHEAFLYSIFFFLCQFNPITIITARTMNNDHDQCKKRPLQERRLRLPVPLWFALFLFHVWNAYGSLASLFKSDKFTTCLTLKLNTILVLTFVLHYCICICSWIEQEVTNPIQTNAG